MRSAAKSSNDISLRRAWALIRRPVVLACCGALGFAIAAAEQAVRGYNNDRVYFTVYAIVLGGAGAMFLVRSIKVVRGGVGGPFEFSVLVGGAVSQGSAVYVENIWARTAVAVLATGVVAWLGFPGIRRNLGPGGANQSEQA